MVGLGCVLIGRDMLDINLQMARPNREGGGEYANQ